MKNDVAITAYSDGLPYDISPLKLQTSCGLGSANTFFSSSAMIFYISKLRPLMIT
jgi:hypothetical protein